MIFLMLLFSGIRGMISVFIKMIQNTSLRNLKDTLVFIFTFSFFQAVFLFIMPPYERLVFSRPVYAYSLTFALFYIMSYIMMIRAVSLGKTAITNIIFSFNFFVPIIIGTFLWNEKISIRQIASIAIFTISVLLFNLNALMERRFKSGNTLKWLLLSCFASIFIGMAGSVSKQYSIDMPGSAKEYLILYNLFVVTMAAPVILLIKNKTYVSGERIRKFILMTAATAFMQNIMNLIFMYYVSRFESASFFPVIAILGIISTVTMTGIVLKEKHDIYSILGILTSISAIIVLAV